MGEALQCFEVLFLKQGKRVMTPRILPVGLCSSLALQPFLAEEIVKTITWLLKKRSLSDVKPINEATFLSFCLRVSDLMMALENTHDSLDKKLLVSVIILLQLEVYRAWG